MFLFIKCIQCATNFKTDLVTAEPNTRMKCVCN